MVPNPKKIMKALPLASVFFSPVEYGQARSPVASQVDPMPYANTLHSVSFGVGDIKHTLQYTRVPKEIYSW